MTDYDFQQLQRKIYHIQLKEAKLQKLYRKETGQNFIPTTRLPKPDLPKGWNPCKQNQGCFFERQTTYLTV
jgi:hypothetical protein